MSAGTNVFVTFSTSGTDTRTYRVDVPLQTVLTNGLTGIGVTAGSNSITTTNGSVVTVYSITDTNIVRILAGAVAATNSVYASNVISGGTMTITGGLLASNTSLTGPQLYVGAGTVQIVNNTGYQPFSFDGTTALFRGNGNALTNLDATKLTGTVPLAQLPGVGVLSNANVWTGVNTFNTTTTNKGISYFGSAGQSKIDAGGQWNVGSYYFAINGDVYAHSIESAGNTTTDSGIIVLGNGSVGTQASISGSPTVIHMRMPGSTVMASISSNGIATSGLLTATNGITKPPISVYAGPVCTNGLSHEWNSNGIVLLRYSAQGGTTWSEKQLAP